MGRFLATLILIAFGLGSVGALKPAIIYFANAAAQTQQNQLSYGKFSRALWNGGRHERRH